MTTVSRADIDERVAQRLAEHDIRYTVGRKLTARALVALAGPATAAQLHDELGREVPLSSLYRTLSLFDEAGINERTHDADGVARYELAEWLLGHHHHLVCNKCGEVEDVELATEVEAQLADIVRAIADGSEYHATGHRIDVEGVCGSCRD
ncbi:MAG: transcriptional repressor [Acidimicrobiia bacterium]|nr:transcriptional repressor [Acidimicrobiia bacterium]